MSGIAFKGFVTPVYIKVLLGFSVIIGSVVVSCERFRCKQAVLKCSSLTTTLQVITDNANNTELSML